MARSGMGGGRAGERKARFPAAGYPVVGDWDGDGFDTLGTKAGLTWTVSNTHAPAAPVTAFSFDFSTATPAQDLPLVWRYGTGP